MHHSHQSQNKSTRSLKSGLMLTACLLLSSLMITGCSLQSISAEQAPFSTSINEFSGANIAQSTQQTLATPTTAEPTPTTTPEPAPTVFSGPPSDDHPVIALTFDDGPSTRDTGTLLDLLAEEEVPVTFFVLGNQMAESQARRDLVLRAFQEGHEIANHGYSHLTLSKASESTVRDELTKTSALIDQITGMKPSMMRAPLNAYNDTTKAVCLELGMSIASWSWQSCPEDWNHRGEPDLIADFVIENAKNGHIILLHDTNSTTVEAMPAMIQGLKDRGFRFMTVSDLLAFGGEGQPAPGQVYSQLKS